MKNNSSSPLPTGPDADDSSGNLGEKTEGVTLITGDPKKAIIKLSGPLIVAMILMSAYNLVDAIWVSGLGGNALAAVGFVTPLFMILVGLSNGIGAGATSAISRCIGARNQEGVNNTAMHTLVITIIISVILTILLEIFLEPLLMFLGAGNTIDLAVSYGRVTFAGTILMLFTGAAYGILRSEGDTKRTMNAMIISSVVNIVLDPVLIYLAGWGIAGAAWATVISQALVSVVILYWFLKKKDTFTTLSWKYFKPDLKVSKSILGVGLPASAEFLVMSGVTAILNVILVMVAGTDAVAVYSAGWRVVMMAIIPMAAVGTAVVTVSGVAHGSRKYKNLRIAHNYSIKVGTVIALITSVITFVFAPYIAKIFAYSPETAYLAPTIASFLQVMCLFYLFVPPGIMSSSIFQGVGKGVTSLILTVFRQLLFIAIFAYILAITLKLGQQGVWWGIVAGDIAGGIVAYVWARLYISRIEKQV
ncbi:MATE family efflux transporter [Methanobacterium sp.]|uniref:MATE family efflux transporter n=1 Tax=Methanobacterium sp. TaxID=2164 RepID=UPI0025F8101B|nr:MATE family efflux transporter [Methanobacterium sp.]MBI5458626.1 MATE family efflux transporter [Methanobacterium sp.]